MAREAKREGKGVPGVMLLGGAIVATGLTLYFATRGKAAPPGAEFEVSDLTISPQEVNPGQPVTISCTVTNIGSEAGSYTVYLGGDFVAQQTVTLAPGESKTVAFTVTPTAAKTYSVSVDGLYGSFVATTLPVADIRVESLVISPTEVYIGEPVTISVIATNYGSATGTKTIICTVT